MSISIPSVDHLPGFPRRVAFCITDLDPGGAEKALLQIISHLDRQLWEPIVFCLGPEAELAPRLRAMGVITLCYGARRWKSWGVFGWLVNELRWCRPALLQCFLFHANIVGRVAGRIAGVPVILAGHRVAERQKSWHLRIEKGTSFLVDHHVCVSRGVMLRLAEATGIASSRISIIPNGVSIPPVSVEAVNLRELCGFPAAAKVVIAVGRLHPQKGFADLLAAFQLVSHRNPLARLVLIGEGSQRPELEAHLHSLRLAKKVTLTGYRNDVVDLLRQSDVLAVSSRWEGMSNVMLEALAVGLPVVTTPVEGVEELQVAFPGQMTVTPILETRFSLALEDRLQASRDTIAVGLVSQNALDKQFTWKVVASEYAHLFSKLLERMDESENSR